MPALFRPLILWLHLLGACIWIGGLGLQVLLLFPALGRRDTTLEHLRFGLSLEALCRRVMWPAVGLVLFTGLVNLLNVWYAVSMLGGSLPPAFLGTLGVKLGLVVCIVLLQAGQQLLLHPRRLRALAPLQTTPAEGAPACHQLQRWACGLSLTALVLASAVLWCAVLLRQG